MGRKQLEGIFPLMPLVLKENQELDLEGLKSNVKAYEELGFDGFVAFGSMGEAFAPSFVEFKKIVDVAVGASKKVACVFGTTSPNTRECIARAKYAEDAGADGIMTGLPYLIPCSAEAAYEHYRQVNDAVNEIQIMVYNNPFTYRFNIDSAFWDKLMKLDRIKAVKESNGDVGHRTTVVSHIAKRINVFSGSEKWLLGDSLVGADSLIAVAGPAVPKATLTFFDACMKKDLDRAVPFHISFTQLLDDLTRENEVAWFKACVELGGLKAGRPSSPYSELDSMTKRRLAERVKRLNEMANAA